MRFVVAFALLTVQQALRCKLVVVVQRSDVFAVAAYDGGSRAATLVDTFFACSIAVLQSTQMANNSACNNLHQTGGPKARIQPNYDQSSIYGSGVTFKRPMDPHGKPASIAAAFAQS